MDSTYPKPDRSDFKPHLSKTPENEILDLGWQEGVLTDGRPFKGEFWCQDQISMITFFFSTVGLENISKEEMERLLESEDLIKFKPGPRSVRVEKFKDASANEMYSVNVMVGDDEETLVEGGRPMNGYRRD